MATMKKKREDWTRRTPEQRFQETEAFIRSTVRTGAKTLKVTGGMVAYIKDGQNY